LIEYRAFSVYVLNLGWHCLCSVQSDVAAALCGV